MNLGLMDLNSWSRQGSEEEDMKQKDLRLNETNKKKNNRLYTTEKQYLLLHFQICTKLMPVLICNLVQLETMGKKKSATNTRSERKKRQDLKESLHL